MRSAPGSLGSVPRWILGIFALCLGCSKTSESVYDESVGMNGGFEQTQEGLPVNWLVYSPSTIPTGRYELGFDKTDFKEGKQSLRFIVSECSSNGGWHSPGVAQELPALPGESYSIRFWIKNQGCAYEVRVGAVDAFTGESESVDSSKGTTTAWKHVEHVYRVPEQYERMSFGLSVRAPGSLWIDGVEIEHLDVSGPRAR